MYRDFQSYIQQGRVMVPNPDNLPPPEAKLVNKWTREHIDLEYTMDVANKTEKISAPSGKHDDYCDSSAMGIHATLSMLPMSGNYGSSVVSRPIGRTKGRPMGNYSQGPLFATTRRSVALNKHSLRNM